MATARSQWDVARRTLTCLKCPTAIGAGEQMRHYGFGRDVLCVECAARVLNETPPPEMPVRDALPTLTPPAEWAPPEPLLMSKRQRRLRNRMQMRDLGYDS